MPTYEYRCDNCAKNFDVVQSFHDDPLTECPTCGSPVRKVFGSVGIVFKGSGFYKTDSRSGSSAPRTVPERVRSASDLGVDPTPVGSPIRRLRRLGLLGPGTPAAGQEPAAVKARRLRPPPPLEGPRRVLDVTRRPKRSVAFVDLTYGGRGRARQGRTADRPLSEVPRPRRVVVYSWRNGRR